MTCWRSLDAIAMVIAQHKCAAAGRLGSAAQGRVDIAGVPVAWMLCITIQTEKADMNARYCWFVVSVMCYIYCFFHRWFCNILWNLQKKCRRLWTNSYITLICRSIVRHISGNNSKQTVLNSIVSTIFVILSSKPFFWYATWRGSDYFKRFHSRCPGNWYSGMLWYYFFGIFQTWMIINCFYGNINFIQSKTFHLICNMMGLRLFSKKL